MKHVRACALPLIALVAGCSAAGSAFVSYIGGITQVWHDNRGGEWNIDTAPPDWCATSGTITGEADYEGTTWTVDGEYKGDSVRLVLTEVGNPAEEIVLDGDLVGLAYMRFTDAAGQLDIFSEAAPHLASGTWVREGDPSHTFDLTGGDSNLENHGEVGGTESFHGTTTAITDGEFDTQDVPTSSTISFTVARPSGPVTYLGSFLDFASIELTGNGETFVIRRKCP